MARGADEIGADDGAVAVVVAVAGAAAAAVVAAQTAVSEVVRGHPQSCGSGSAQSLNGCVSCAHPHR